MKTKSFKWVAFLVDYKIHRNIDEKVKWSHLLTPKEQVDRVSPNQYSLIPIFEHRRFIHE